MHDATGALADFDAALRLDPRFTDAWSNRAALRGELGDLAAPRTIAAASRKLAPASAVVPARRGALLHRQKKLAAALVEYDRALTLNPRLYWVYVLRGNVRYHLGDSHGLRADYIQAFALAPEHSGAMAARTIKGGWEVDPGEALAHADELVRQDPPIRSTMPAADFCCSLPGGRMTHARTLPSAWPGVPKPGLI